MTRPLSEFTFIDEYQARKRQKTLDTLRQTTEKKLSLENGFSPYDVQRAWYGTEALCGPFSPPPVQPVARASTPTPEEEQGSFRYTQMLSTMEIPTFEDTLKPLSGAYSTWLTHLGLLAVKGKWSILWKGWQAFCDNAAENWLAAKVPSLYSVEKQYSIQSFTRKGIIFTEECQASSVLQINLGQKGDM